MRILFLAFLFMITSVGAVPNLGLTTLYYAADSQFANKPKATDLESGQVTRIIQFNHMVTNNVQTELASFPRRLRDLLSESGTFVVFDAMPMIQVWSVKEPNMIGRWQSESVTVDVEDKAADKISTAESATAKKKPQPVQPADNKLQKKPPSNKYILVGWVSSIKADQIRQQFPGTDKTSILYNLNIEINYKIIDADTQRVITQFVAAGHGGIARIIPSNQKQLIIDAGEVAHDVAEDAVDTLLLSVKHGLLIKQDLGLLPK